MRNVEAPEIPQPQIVKPLDAPEPAPRWQEPIEKPEPRIAQPPLRRALVPAITEPAPIQATPNPEAKPIEEQIAITAPVESVPVAETDPSAVPSMDAQNVEDEGLSLRFASDGDFLRLIAKGEIEVYAYNESGVFALQPNYQFLRSSAPGQVFELMEQTVPKLIVDALGPMESGAAPFTWAIAIPLAIRTQIENHMASVRNGQLVINRYGEVHHVARHRS